MKALLEQIARSQQPLGTTLVVGAGAGSDLPDLRTLPGERLVLAEAHARQAEELARRIVPARGEEVWPLAIVATPARQATLHILNNPHFNSLKPPTELGRHYPNLRVTGQIDVAARTLAESIDSLVLDDGRPHLLILDAPGQAGDLLSATASQALQSFTWIILRCSVAPLYADDKQAQGLLEQLAEVGFDAGEDDPQSLYPQASFLLTRNQPRVEKLRLEARLAQASIECETQALLARQREQDIERLTQGRDQATTLVQKYKAQLDATLKDAATGNGKQAEDLDKQARLAEQYKSELDKANQTASEQHKLATDRHSQVQELTKERDEQSKLAAQQKAELDKANQTASEQLKLATDRHSQIQELNQERDEQSKLAAQQKAELDKANQTASEQHKLATDRHAKIQQMSEELVEAHQTSSLSVRLQALREADLKDLQGRYQDLMEKNENQHHLLVRLSERLTVAADYFHQLTQTENANPSLDERTGRPAKVIKPSPSRKSSRNRPTAQ
ncbi:hypothetical protein ACW7G0_00845 [Lysobacter sp. A286]